MDNIRASRDRLNIQIRHSDLPLALCEQRSNILVNVNEILTKTALENLEYMNIYNSLLRKKLCLPPYRSQNALRTARETGNVNIPIMPIFIRGSINQGDDCFNDQSRGKQCAFNSLLGLLTAYKKPITQWSPNYDTKYYFIRRR